VRRYRQNSSPCLPFSSSREQKGKEARRSTLARSLPLSLPRPRGCASPCHLGEEEEVVAVVVVVEEEEEEEEEE
jgi:hypothetical protein